MGFRGTASWLAVDAVRPLPLFPFSESSSATLPKLLGCPSPDSSFRALRSRARACTATTTASRASNKDRREPKVVLLPHCRSPRIDSCQRRERSRSKARKRRRRRRPGRTWALATRCLTTSARCRSEPNRARVRYQHRRCNSCRVRVSSRPQRAASTAPGAAADGTAADLVAAASPAAVSPVLEPAIALPSSPLRVTRSAASRPPSCPALLRRSPRPPSAHACTQTSASGRSEDFAVEVAPAEPSTFLLVPARCPLRALFRLRRAGPPPPGGRFRLVRAAVQSGLPTARASCGLQPAHPILSGEARITTRSLYTLSTLMGHATRGPRALDPVGSSARCSQCRDVC